MIYIIKTQLLPRLNVCKSRQSKNKPFNFYVLIGSLLYIQGIIIGNQLSLSCRMEIMR